MSNLNQTIVAPATNIVTQAIAVIRISGDDALEIINKLVKKVVPQKRGFYYRQLFDHDVLVDEVVVSYYQSPNSFTGEEVIEITCHGGVLNTNRIIDLILQNGAKMALKGEFSQRAFLNGKIDLIQAEGINDLIHATNELALKIGVNNMSGAHNQAILDLKTDLLDIISRIQVSIDYPDYDDIEGSSITDLTKLLETINQKVKQIILRSKIAMKNIEGINTVIIGETNVGKSSLLNALISEDKAIVTEIAGTTRDIVEGQINLGNTTINLIDTAGIRKTTDAVENLGIQKSRKYLQEADLVLYVVNGDNYSNFENQEMYASLKDKQHLVILNKAATLDEAELRLTQDYYPEPLILTNAISGDINDLIANIQELYDNEAIIKDDELILINLNQISLLEQVANLVEKAHKNILEGYPIDILNVDLNNAWNILGELIGEQYDEEIIDNIFRKYCLGK